MAQKVNRIIFVPDPVSVSATILKTDINKSLINTKKQVSWDKDIFENHVNTNKNKNKRKTISRKTTNNFHSGFLDLSEQNRLKKWADLEVARIRQVSQEAAQIKS